MKRDMSDLIGSLYYVLAPGVHTYSQCKLHDKGARGGRWEDYIADEMVKLGAPKEMVRRFVVSVKKSNAIRSELMGIAEEREG